MNDMVKTEIDPKDTALLERFVKESEEILGKELVGIYLHGSAVMGCYNPDKSDLDLILVVQDELKDEVKKAFMDMVVKCNAEGPEKGLELSIVKRGACDPFVYPTPFELHFSVMHLGWYLEDPEGYIENMKGTDRDLAAHFTVIRARGKCLCGAPVEEVFGEVSEKDYLDSLWYDIEGAEAEIDDNTMYLTLNLARVMAYLEEKRVLSKQEGGEWGLKKLPEKYHALIREALREYGGEEPEYDTERAEDYAAYMLECIRTKAGIKEN